MVFRAIGCGRRGENAELVEEIQRLQTSLEAVGLNRQRDPEVGGESENEGESHEEGRVVATNLVEIRLLMLVIGESMRPNPEIPTYHGDLYANELLDWINEMDKFFEYDKTDGEKKVKFEVTRLKAHAALWWNGVQTERRNNGNNSIKS